MLYVFNEFLQTYYQTILETMLTTLDTILEFFVLLIPITFLLMHYYGIYGVCAAVPISELLTIFIVEGTRKFLQDRDKLPQEGLLMIPNPAHDDSFDVTIEAGEENAVNISKKIIDYCRAKNVDERTAYILGLAAEEIAVNISRYGYGKIKKPIFLTTTNNGFCVFATTAFLSTRPNTNPKKKTNFCSAAKVYFTRKIDAAHLIKLYKLINEKIFGKVAIKLHTGEKHDPNILPRDMVQAFQA